MRLFSLNIFIALLLSYNVSANVNFPERLPSSCAEIRNGMHHSAESGVYRIGANEDGVQQVYCFMGTLCNSDGGWTRLAYLDMSDGSACPSEWRLYEVNGVRACGRPASGAGFRAVIYPSHGVQYSQICGRVRGYQYASPDAVDSIIGTGHNDINAQYVDGVSLTRGSPRKHVWTFMAGLKEDNSFNGGTYTCPCQEGSQQASNIPDFIDDYFCESGNPASPASFAARLYTEDALWDGEQCRGLESACCSEVPNLPWFNKILSETTDDYLEFRISGDQGTGDEDVAIELIEVYVK